MKTDYSINASALSTNLNREMRVWCVTNLPIGTWRRILHGDMRLPPFSYAWTYTFTRSVDLVAFKLKFGI